MNSSKFQSLLQPVTSQIAGQQLNDALADDLNRQFPADGKVFEVIEKACHQAISEGWMCTQGSEGRRFGRIIEPSCETNMLSVDVVDLQDIVGPHHRHPGGEVCMIMPVNAEALFDGKGRGWCVYEPNSAHNPTVTNGEALVLYMLPDGEIEFTNS
ncbi:MAG: DUF4863 family protein [Gammaproteobacteria bacterium]|nr:DUF4863 family protein [Gammaproteobacteria bacterium]